LFYDILEVESIIEPREPSSDSHYTLITSRTKVHLDATILFALVFKTLHR